MDRVLFHPGGVVFIRKFYLGGSPGGFCLFPSGLPSFLPIFRAGFPSFQQLQCPILCSPIDCSMPGSSAHGTFQARIRDLVVISFSRASSQPRDRSCVSYISHIVRQFLYLPGKAPTIVGVLNIFSINPICLSQLKSVSVIKTKNL